VDIQTLKKFQNQATTSGMDICQADTNSQLALFAGFQMFRQEGDRTIGKSHF